MARSFYQTQHGQNVDASSRWIVAFVTFVFNTVTNEGTWERLGLQFVISVIPKIGEAFVA